MRPKVVVSKCLGFCKCRYNGQVIPNRFIEKLKDHVDFIPVCPEVEIGLGVPRDPIRIVDEGGQKLVQPKTGKDVTEMMETFAKGFLKKVDADGYILKYGSPSCGPSNVRIYKEGKRPGRGAGFFARHVDGLVEDEGRLSNLKIRENFLTKLFLVAAAREHDYLDSNQCLLKSYGAEKPTREEIMKLRSPQWEDAVMALFRRFELEDTEKDLFLQVFQEFKENRVCLSTILRLIESYATRFNDEYVLKQTILHPFPQDLVDMSDTGKR